VVGVLNVFLSKVKAETASHQSREKQRGQAEARWWQSILMAVVSKNHRAVVVDEDNSVLYTNFPLAGTAAGDGKLHLLDVIDSQQQDVLRLVGVALDRPNQLVEADTIFRAEPCHVKAVHLEEEGELRRTLIIFEPKAGGGADITLSRLRFLIFCVRGLREPASGWTRAGVAAKTAVAGGRTRNTAARHRAGCIMTGVGVHDLVEAPRGEGEKNLFQNDVSRILPVPGPPGGNKSEGPRAAVLVDDQIDEIAPALVRLVQREVVRILSSAGADQTLLWTEPHRYPGLRPELSGPGLIGAQLLLGGGIRIEFVLDRPAGVLVSPRWVGRQPCNTD